MITDCSEKSAAASHPRVSEKELANDREGLLVGSAGEDGEVFQAILDGKSGAELQTPAAFYDYLEIQPVFCDDSEIAARAQTVNQAIVQLGDLLHIPVIASCNAYLLDARDALGWKLLRRLKGVETAENAIPPHFRTTEEMLQEFQYLGKEKAAEVVITNTNRIADKIEVIRPIPSGRHLLRAPGSDSTLRKICTEKASELYGDPLPEVVASRLNRELETIIRRGYDEALLLVQKIVKNQLQMVTALCRGAHWELPLRRICWALQMEIPCRPIIAAQSAFTRILNPRLSSKPTAAQALICRTNAVPAAERRCKGWPEHSV